jgi:hypothetical protein
LLAERLEKAWCDLKALVPIDPVIRLADEGLVLGAGTILARASRAWRNDRIGDPARLAALLSAAYSRPTSTTTLNHVRRAAEQWDKGDRAPALVHLSLSGLERLDDPESAAKRLFLADCLIEAGLEPETILRVLAGGRDSAGLERRYNPGQPRVPAGSGRVSGQWTSGGAAQAADAQGHASAGSKKPPIVVSGAIVVPLPGAGPLFPPGLPDAAGAWLTRLSKAAAAQLVRMVLLSAGESAAGALGGGLLLNLLVVTNVSLRKEGTLAGASTIHYVWHSDQRSLVLSSTDSHGVSHTAVVDLGGDGRFRDNRGRIVGLLLASGAILIDRTHLTGLDATTDNEPNYCPAPTPDTPHGSSERALAYEDMVKKHFNPDNPTPRGLAVNMPNPEGGKPVHYDDCEHATGALIEAKGPGYAYKLAYGGERATGILDQWTGQSRRQVLASQGRPVYWVFAEAAAAEEAQKLFSDLKGRETIRVMILPWRGGKRWP